MLNRWHSPAHWGKVILHYLRTHASGCRLLFTLAAAGLITLGSVELILTPPVLYPFVRIADQGLTLILLGGLALGVAIWLSRVEGTLLPLMTPTLEPIDRAGIGRGWLPLIVGIILLALLTEIGGRVFHLAAFEQVDSGIQLALLYGGVVLVAWALAGMPRPRRFPISREFAIVALLTLVAFGVRVWHLDTSQRVLIDETNFFEGARGAADWYAVRLTATMSGSSPYTALYVLWQAQAGMLFGRGIFAIRFVSAVLGALMIPALYLLARALFDQKTALIAAALLITFPPQLHYSRTSINQMGDALFGLLALAFMARALRANRAADWALAGVALGLASYFFEAGRLFFPMLIAAWIGLTIVTQPGVWRRQWHGFARLAAGAIIIAAPVYGTLFAEGRSPVMRLDSSGIGISYWTQGDLTEHQMFERLDRLKRPFLFYFAIPEQGAILYYAGTEPLVLRVFAPFLFLGLFYVLWQPRRAAWVLIPWIIGMAAAVGIFIREVQLSTRFVGAMPALVLLMAVGIRCGLRLIWVRAESAARGTAARLWRTALPAAITVGMSIIQVTYYFGPHLHDLNVRSRDALTYHDTWDAVYRAAELPYETQSFFVAEAEFDAAPLRDLLGYLVFVDKYPIEMYVPDAVTPEMLASLPRDRNYAFFVRPALAGALSAIYRAFPEAQPVRFTTVEMQPSAEYLLVFVPQPHVP